MEENVDYSEKDRKASAEDALDIDDIDIEGRIADMPLSSFDTKELTSKPKVSISRNEGNAKPRQSSAKREFLIQLEPSLNEKLAKTRATADELEDKLQKLRSNFKGELQSVDRIKRELKNKETQLLDSVQKIEGYMRQIYSLKREADNMFERLKSTSVQLALDFSFSTREHEYIHIKKGAAIVILKYHRPAQSCLRSAMCDLSEYKSIKDLVEYYLVLTLLHEDLLDENKRRLEKVQRYSDEQRNIGERARNLPLDILAKEEALYKTNSKIKEMRLKNIELDKQQMKGI